MLSSKQQIYEIKKDYTNGLLTSLHIYELCKNKFNWIILCMRFFLLEFWILAVLFFPWFCVIAVPCRAFGFDNWTKTFRIDQKIVQNIVK